MTAYKVGDHRLYDKFLWLPLKFNKKWYWLKKVCIMQRKVSDTKWVTIKIMDF